LDQSDREFDANVLVHLDEQDVDYPGRRLSPSPGIRVRPVRTLDAWLALAAAFSMPMAERDEMRARTHEALT
jgi:hypothetical protein